MKYMIFTVMLACTFAATAQDKQENILQVTGQAEVYIKPDVGVLNINVSNISPTMNEAIDNLGSATNEYIKVLEKLKFNAEDVKTTGFTVNKNTIYNHDGPVDKGYIASQQLKIEFAYDKQVLSRILNEFAKSAPEANFSFSFKLSDKLKSETRNRVIELAVKDATVKAQVITTASGQKTGRIRKIVYGTAPNHPFEQPMYRYDAMMATEGDKAYNFTPDDLLFQDSISMEWVME